MRRLGLSRRLPWLAAVFALGCAGGPPPPGPFYTAPPEAATRAPGKLIRSEEMSDPPPGAKAWRILYSSTGLDGEPVAVSGIVVAPQLPAPIAGRHVVAWAHPTAGVADNCAPSLRKEVFDTIPHLQALIALDYVVTATDYPGLGTAGPHPYLVGESEGRAVIDSVRAAREIEKAGASVRYAVWGHSQGGQAALFAGELAPIYAPELSLAGVAAIAPATDLAQLLADDVAERAGRLIASYSLWSWSRVYGAPLEPVVTEKAVAIIDRAARDCIETWGEVYRAVLRHRRAPRRLPEGRGVRGRAVEGPARAEPAGPAPDPGADLRRAGAGGHDRPPLGDGGLRGRPLPDGRARALREPSRRRPHAGGPGERHERHSVDARPLRREAGAHDLSAAGALSPTAARPQGLGVGGAGGAECSGCRGASVFVSGGGFSKSLRSTPALNLYSSMMSVWSLTPSCEISRR